MASYLHLLQHTKPQFESPAKVFAKLKSKVQKEAMCAKGGDDPLNNVREAHGAEFKSPRKKQQRIWMTDELDENQRFGSEAQPLTLSPIKSPQKTSLYSYSDFSRKPLEEMPPAVDIGPGFTRRERTFLESTAASHSLFLANQIRKDSPKVRDSDRFTVCGRTPLELQPVENERRNTVSDEECAPLLKPVSPANAFSPMVKRLRKRKWEQQEKVRNENTCQPQERKAPAFSEENTHSTCMNIRGFSADGPEMIHEAMFSPRKSTAETRCGVVLEKIPTMSPAKMFAYMKERESKRELQEVHKVINRTRDLFNAGNSLQSRDSPLSTPHSVAEREDSVFTNTPESEVPVNQRMSESADQSDADPSEDALISAVSPKAVLLEDPLVLNSPQISIPKKQEAVFKRNKWPKQAKFPSESVISLKKWFLRKNHKGLFVDGIHREDNIKWNSNVIVHRVSNSVIKTVSGRVYILVGKMNLHVESDFPRWFLKKFEKGFPPNWKALYDKMLTESRDNQSTGRERNSDRRGIKSKQKSEVSPINSSVKQHRQKSFKTPESCPPISSSSNMKVSRSGRVIKPPLEYWKGGRVILDAFMNVTIHECYDTSICNPEVTTTVSTRMSQEPVHVFLPCSEGEKEASVPLRRVKAPLYRRNRVKANPDEKPPDSFEPAAEPLRSPEKGAGGIKRSGQRCSAKERELHVDTVPKQQSDNEKPSAQRSQIQSQGSCKASARLTKSKQTVVNSPETPPVKISQQLSSDDDLSIKRKKRGKGGHSKNSRDAHSKSQPNHRSSSSKSSEEQKENKEYSTQKSQKHRSHGTHRPAARVTTRKRTVINSLESPPVDDEISQHLSSDDELPARRKKRGKGAHSKNSRNAHSKSQPKRASSSNMSEDSDDLMRHKQKQKSSKCTKAPAHTKPLPGSTQSSKKHDTNKGNTQQEHDEDKWTEAELMRLQEAVSYYPKHMVNYWAKVARMVGTRSAEECHSQHTSQGTSCTPAKKATKPKKEPKAPVTDHPVISARVGTLKRKQQVRQFLETMPREDVDDVFSSEYMQNKRFELPSLCSDDEEDLAVSDLEPLTPMSTRFPEVKTPQCLHITPGMMGSPNRDNDDKYVYQLQKRIKKNQFNACKRPPPSKSFTPTPSVKRTMRRCGNTENDTFVVWEMFPGNDEALSESGEEEDFYFSDND